MGSQRAGYNWVTEDSSIWMKCLAHFVHSRSVHSFPSFLGVWGFESQDSGLREQPFNLGMNRRSMKETKTQWMSQLLGVVYVLHVVHSDGSCYAKKWCYKEVGATSPPCGLLHPGVSWFLLPTQMSDDCIHTSLGSSVISPNFDWV